MTTPEGMDAAQLARNIAEGRGYTTLFVRPFSLFLVQRQEQARAPDPVRTGFRISRGSRRRIPIWRTRRCIRSCWRD